MDSQASRIPFDYELVDKRHRAFVEGRSSELLSFYDIWKEVGITSTLIRLALPIFFFYMSVPLPGIIYNNSVTWRTETAVVDRIYQQLGNSSVAYRYDYAFTASDGKTYRGFWVLGSGSAFRTGDGLPVRYVESDPSNNRPVNESFPKSMLLWVFFGIGALLLTPIVMLFQKIRAARSELRRLAKQGGAAAAVVTFCQQQGLNLLVQYESQERVDDRPIFSGATETPFTAIASSAPPRPGTKVAVWNAPQIPAARLL